MSYFPVKQDDIYVIEVIDYMVKEMGIQRELLKRDWFLILTRGEHQYVDHVEYTTFDQNVKFKLQRPDIIYENYNGTIKCLIEIDGSIHNTKSGKHKTHKRNRVYEDANIHLIAINNSDLDLIDLDWRDYLRSEIAKL